MLVPFATSVTKLMIPVLGHIIDQLSGLLRLGCEMVAGKPSDLTDGHIWDALQCELALEKFFWGKIQRFGFTSAAYLLAKQLAVNLGPGHNILGRSATDESGFLKLSYLAEAGVLSSREPPISLWVTNRTQVKKGNCYVCYSDSLFLLSTFARILNAIACKCIRLEE